METLTWEIRVPIFKNRQILIQLGLAIGIPFGLLVVLLISLGATEGLLLVGAALLLAFVLVLVVFRDTYDVAYTLTSREITCATQPAQQKRVRRMAGLTIAAGVLGRSPTTVGAGILSTNRLQERMAFSQIRVIRYRDAQQMVWVRGASGRMAVFCHPDNYSQVKHILQEAAAKNMV